MTRDRVDESGYRHNLAVRVGVDGPKGRLLRCRKRDNSGHYWRIRLADSSPGATSKWVWPDERMIVDSPGDVVGRCAECGLQYMTRGDSPLCPSHTDAAFGSQEQRAEDGGRFDRVRWKHEDRGHGHRR